MPEGLGARLAIENGFLILLAVGAAVADLDPIWIVFVMAIGWFLVALVELLAWRARPAYAWAPAAPATILEEGELAPPPPAYVPAYAAPVEPEPEYPPVPVAPEPEPPVAEPEAAPEPVPAEPRPEAVGASGEYEFSFARPGAAAGDETAVSRPEPSAPVEEYTTTLFQRPGARRERVRLEPLLPQPRRRLFGLLPPREQPPPPAEPPAATDEEPAPGEEQGSERDT